MNLNKAIPTNHSITIFACLVIVCTQAGIVMYSPSMPFLSDIFNTTQSLIAYTLTAYIFGYGVSVLIIGGLSDQTGRKFSFILSISLFTLSSLLIAITHSIFLFIILRFLQGLGGGGCAVTARATVRDIYTGKQLVKAMSAISISFIISMGLFQFIGGIIQTHSDYRFDFILMACYGLILLLLTAYFLKDENTPTQNKIIFKQVIFNYWKIVKDKYLIVMAMGGSMGYCVILAFNILGIYYLQKILAITPENIGLIGIYLSSSYLVGSILVNILIKSYDINTLIRMSLIITLIASISFLIVTIYGQKSLFNIITPLMIINVGQAILYPCVMVNAMERYPSLSGTSGSLFGFTQQMCGLLITLVCGIMPHQSLISLGLIVIGTGIISAVLLIRMSKIIL